jgi:hypothetical protein
MVSPEVESDPEILAFGPAAPRPRQRRVWLVAAVVILALVAGWGVWRWWPRPPADFTLVDLEGVYAGMVRSDGLNDASTLTRDKLTQSPVSVRPAECAPLFDATLSNQFPATAQDGVSAYWLDEGSASISLVTYRYLDPDAAAAQFDLVQTALRACLGSTLAVDQDRGVRLEEQELDPPATTKRYLSYLVAAQSASTRFTTDVLLVDNTVTWQYRYDYHSRETYSPLAAQQLMASLVTQMRSVQAMPH